MRHPLEVPAAVPEHVLVGARLSFDEERERGLTAEESLTVAQDLVGAGVQFVSALQGSIETDAVLGRRSAACTRCTTSAGTAAPCAAARRTGTPTAR